jgi:hypothetical protein
MAAEVALKAAQQEETALQKAAELRCNLQESGPASNVEEATRRL